MRIAKWNTASHGTVLIEQNTHIDSLLLLFSGSAVVDVNGKIVAGIREGSFMGEMSFITGNVTTAKVVADTQIRYLTFGKDELLNVMKKHKEVDDGMKSIFNIDLINKLSNPENN
jgi:CRP-like cAMP-binding protein